MIRKISMAALALLAAPAFAQLVNENLLVGLPDGYKIGFRDHKNTMDITEMVPAWESVNAWSEMVTVQIFFALKAEPQQFKARIESGWMQACPAGAAQDLAEQNENGYPALTWRLSCPLLRATAKPEFTWFKVIAGSDSFYVVQKAFRFEPTAEQIASWTRYLDAVTVCDSRLADRACPPARQ